MNKLSKNRCFNECVENSVKNNWELFALCDYKGKQYRYKDVAAEIAKLHILFSESGIEKGDRIAICGRNSANWGIAFFASLTYGSVVVPILNEFKPDQVHHIVEHSEAKILFVGDVVKPTLNVDKMPNLKAMINIPDFSLAMSREEKIEETQSNLEKLFVEKYPSFSKENVCFYKNENPEELALINYTSGTSGFSKGVMIPYRAIYSNLEFGFHVLGADTKPGDKVLSILPMAHMYGMAFEFLYEFCAGIQIYFLGKAPSPTIMLGAFAEIKPRLVVAVPLVIEKIVRKAILPKLNEPAIKILTKIPLVNQLIYKKFRIGLQNALGGNFYEVIIGGAAFNADIEKVLRKIKFNYTVGYGATECAPIITYEDWKKFAQGSCGKQVINMEVKIDSKDPLHEVGEILARGENVMLGYYKNPEATAEALDSEGWYHTGDLGLMDKKGNVFIKGRSKNMLLGASGQNIYPEEIEDKLNNMPFVLESVVIQRDEKLYALIVADVDAAKANGIEGKEAILEQMEKNRKEINNLLANYEKLAGVKLMDEEFEKTPKKSIKRYLYTNVEI